MNKEDKIMDRKELLNKIKLEMMDEFIMKVNMYGVRKFQREGIKNPELLYQIKHHDNAIRFETLEKYIDLINKLIERNEK